MLVDRAMPRRMARHPLRWFFGLWGAMTAIWLASGSIHAWIHRRPDVPPPPPAIPYRDFLPGGARQASYPIPLDPDRLPVHDAALLPPDTFFTEWLNEDQTAGRLVCQFEVISGAYGWPRQWVRWSRFVNWDVTDPTQPFQPAPAHPKFFIRHITWEPFQLSWVVMTGDGSRYWVGAWQWARMLVWAVGIEALAALVVLALGGSHAWRMRRRLRLGRCVECGYDLRGGASASCPECGAPPVAVPSGTRRTPVIRIFLGSWALLALAWVTATAVFPQPRAFPRLEDRAADLAREAEQKKQRATGDWMVGQNYYGWPWSIGSVSYSQTWVCDPGGQPHAMIDPRMRNSFGAGDGHIQWTRLTGDPTIMRVVDAYWPATLAALAGLQFPAWLIAGAWAMVARITASRSGGRGRRA